MKQSVIFNLCRPSEVAARSPDVQFRPATELSDNHVTKKPVRGQQSLESHLLMWWD